MIICHKHKFIFIKTRKTAGSSMEIMLSKLCDENDVVTTLSEEENEVRRALGYGEPRNTKIPFGKYSKTEKMKLLLMQKHVVFEEHWPAKYIKARLEPGIWEEYFKFAFDRNPFDKVVSYYYWKKAQEKHSRVIDFIRAGGLDPMSSYDLYSYANRVIVDQVYKYEEMDESLADISQRLGLKEVISLPEYKAKGSFRAKKGYRDMLDEETIKEISVMFAREIAFLGYEY